MGSFHTNQQRQGPQPRPCLLLLLCFSFGCLALIRSCYHDERLVSVLFCVLKFFVSEATERIPFVRRVDAYIGDPEDGHGKPWQAARYGTGSVFLE